MPTIRANSASMGSEPTPTTGRWTGSAPTSESLAGAVCKEAWPGPWAVLALKEEPIVWCLSTRCRSFESKHPHTRRNSAASQLHGTLFEYLRNDALDSNNWFNNSVSPQLPKAEERQNNFGGTLGGPLRKGRTFFFFSYEGNRLRLPRTLLTTVPSLSARTAATSVMQPFFNAFPLPSPGGVDHGDGTADLNASFSDRSSLNAVSLRIDHNVNSRLNLFGRYNYAPSDIANRGAGGNAPNVISTTKFITQTGTLGVTWTVSPQVWNDFRFNYSRNHSTNDTTMDGFLGAVPLPSLPFPSPYTTKDANFYLNMPFLGLAGIALQAGYGQELIQRQFNIIDSFYMQRGSHSLKFC